MKLHFCVACGEQDVGLLEYHHLVPRSAGGSNDERNLLTLCHVCHGLAHGYQRQNISALTRSALAVAKARGTKLGGTRWDHLAGDAGRRGHAAGLRTRAAAAISRAADLAPIIAELRAAGVTSLGGLAMALTKRGIPTSRGHARWSATQVARMLKSADVLRSAPS